MKEVYRLAHSKRPRKKSMPKLKDFNTISKSGPLPAAFAKNYTANEPYTHVHVMDPKDESYLDGNDYRGYAR